jgi:phosphoribosylformylglycinamidine synthase I
MKAAVVVFPGINRENDMARALERGAGATVSKVWHTETALPAGTDLVAVPGGFSYGDYLRCGAIAGRSPIMKAIVDHAARGGLVLGVCNGFQILTEAGLLPGALMRNAGLKFVCKKVRLSVENDSTFFTRSMSKGMWSPAPWPTMTATILPTPKRSRSWKVTDRLCSAMPKAPTPTARSTTLPAS